MSNHFCMKLDVKKPAAQASSLCLKALCILLTAFQLTASVVCAQQSQPTSAVVEDGAGESGSGKAGTPERTLSAAAETDVSMPPSDNSKISTTVFTWWVADAQGNVLPNSQLRFVVKVVPKSGGHNHDDSSRPSLKIAVSSTDQVGQVDTGFVPTGSTGKIVVAYIAPKVAGDMQLTISGIDPQGNPSNTATRTVHVRVPGLIELTGGGAVTNYDLKAPTTEHSKSYFGTPGMVQALSTLADEYAAENNGDKLPCNDMSIEWGGIFDLKKNWSPPHSEHAKGVDADIRAKLIDPRRRLRLLQMANKLGFNVLIHDGTVLGDTPHWHLRYHHGPDCEIYKRGKCDLTAPLPAIKEVDSAAQSVAPVLHIGVQVSQDPVTKLFKYSYTFANDPASTSEVSAIQLLVNQSVVLDVKSPNGWTSEMWTDGAAVAFAATDTGALPPGFVDDGLLVPSPFQIKPGQSLSGFSFLSPDPPGSVEILAQGFQQLPIIDESNVNTDSGGLAENSFKGTVQGPVGATNIPNRIDDTAFYVWQHYQDFLSRDPDTSGFQFWTGEITGCGTNQLCREVKRINVSAAFFLSIEFQETGYFVYRIYKTSFGNLPGAPVPLRREEMMPDTRRIGQGVVVGVGDWQQRLNANKDAYAIQFVAGSRFTSAFPTNMTAAQFVDKLDQNAGGVLSAAERANLVGQLTNPADTQQRAGVLRRVAEDTDLSQREFNNAFVLMQYFGYLQRNPNDAPDTDFSGYNFWLSKLNQFGGNFVNAEMVKAFISSTEYRQRFGQ